MSIKLAHPFPAPELRDTNFTDTRIFLKKGHFPKDFAVQNPPKLRKNNREVLNGVGVDEVGVKSPFFQFSQ